MVTGIISQILAHKGSQLWSVPADATVFEALQLMAEKNVGALLVTQGGCLYGVITERDYARKVTLLGRNSRETRVRDITSLPPITATPAHTVEDGMRLMTEHKVRHLPILEGEQLRGIISIGDLVNWTISAQSVAIDQLESYITGH